MNILDREVFTVLMTLIILSSIASALFYINPFKPEPYVTLAILNPNCEIGEYPEIVFNNTNTSLCIYIDNHLGFPALFKIEYRISYERPNHPDQGYLLDKIIVFLGDNANKTIKYNASVKVYKSPIEGVYLVYTLWYLDPSTGNWVYSGRIVYLYVRVLNNPLG